MAFTNYIQQITATNGTTHDLVDSSASHYVKGTQTSSTNAWTGALPDGVTAYYDGLSIDYFLPYAGTSTAATLNLGSKGAKPVYVGNGTGGVTTHFPQYSVIHLTYIINSNLNSGNGCWKATGYYNTNDDYRVRTVARGTTKAYVLGTTTAPTSSNQNVTSVSETGVYLETSNSATRLIAPTFVGALTGTASGNLTSSSTLDATKLSGTIPSGCYTNTKNTAGSTDTSSKIFLIGATSQAANPQTYSHDTAYVGTDGCLYSNSTKVLTAHQTIKQDGVTGATINRYAACTTAAGTAAKTVTLTNGNFTLEAGAKVAVYFQNKNTAAAPTLNVNSTGAKNIVYYDGQSGKLNAATWQVYGMVELVYDGTYWQFANNPSPLLLTTYNSSNSGYIPIIASTTGGYIKYNSNLQISNGVLKSSALPMALYNSAGAIMPAYSTTGTATLTTAAASNTSSPTIAAKTTTSGRYYGVEIDSNGVLFVNVPWTNVNNSYLTASSTLDATKLSGTIPTSCYTNTDEKVKTAAVTKGTTYYPVLGSNTTAAATKYFDNAGLKYITSTTNSITSSTLQIGDNADNAYGALQLFTPTSGVSVTLVPPGGTANRTITLPDATATLATTADIPTGNATPTASVISKFDSSAKMNSTDMTSSQVSTFVNSLDVSGALPVDYIIAQGTSGIWTYRKWNSGIAECWGSVYAQKDCTSAWGNVYDSGTATSQSFPSGLFTSAPTLTLTAVGHSTATLQLETSGAVLADRTCNYYYVMPYSATGVQATVCFHAVGRWK